MIEAVARIENFAEDDEKHTINGLLDSLRKQVVENVEKGVEENGYQYFLILKLSILKLKDDIGADTVEHDETFDSIVDFIETFEKHQNLFR